MKEVKDYLNEVANRYVAYFDITRNIEVQQQPIYFHAHYVQRDERYLMSKAVKMWGVEHEQHIFVKEPTTMITKKEAEQFILSLKKEIEKNETKNEDHMSTIVIGLIPIVSNKEVDNDLKKFMQKFRKFRFVKYGLHGWFEYYIGLIDYHHQTIYIHKKAKPFLQGFDARKKEQ